MTTVALIGLMIVMGLGLRAAGLGRIGFAEDEINKLEAVRAYDRGDLTANAEHPMLVKALIDVSYAVAPHYALYTNAIGTGYATYFFPHDEFYDDGLNDAIRFVCERALRNSTLVTETPGAVRYYTEKVGRTDLQSRILSDPKFIVTEPQPAYVILQRGRTYFENQNKMKEVRDRFTLVYAGCISGHTAAEVYAVSADPSVAVKPCGDARP
jgi:hypothetical protein